MVGSSYLRVYIDVKMFTIGYFYVVCNSYVGGSIKG